MSNTPDGYVDAVAYIQVEGRDRRMPWRNGRRDGKPVVHEAAAISLTQSRPGRPKGGTVTVKVTLRMPVAAFDPLEPEAIVQISADLTQANPVEVEVGDATAQAEVDA